MSSELLAELSLTSTLDDVALPCRGIDDNVVHLHRGVLGNGSDTEIGRLPVGHNQGQNKVRTGRYPNQLEMAQLVGNVGLPTARYHNAFHTPGLGDDRPAEQIDDSGKYSDTGSAFEHRNHCGHVAAYQGDTGTPDSGSTHAGGDTRPAAA